MKPSSKDYETDDEEEIETSSEETPSEEVLSVLYY